jgi:glycosyltransferase involved in cell wall biosynthesis
MTVVWINKRNWMHPGPIVNVGVRNAHSFAGIGLPSHLFLGEGTTGGSTVDDLRNFYALEPLPNFTVHRVPRRRRLLGSESASVRRAGARFVRELAARDEVAVFTRDAGFLPRLAWMCRGARVRGFYELHDLYADLSWREHRPRARDLREKWLERLFLPRISGLVCITREMERRYRRIFPRQATIARPLGTDPLPATDVEARRKSRTIFYVGHMHGPKGVSFLRKAAIALAARGVRTEFWGGYEADVVRLRQAAESRGLDQWIEAVPFQPPAVLRAALAERASLGVVMLADTYYNRYLTCPVKALDYLSHGIPALGTDIPSVREVLDDSGVYVTEGDQEGFLGAALRLLDDPAAYAEAVTRTRARAAQITWQERARALADFARSRF